MWGEELLWMWGFCGWGTQGSAEGEQGALCMGGSAERGNRELHMGTGHPADEKMTQSFENGQGSQQNRGTGMPGGRREHGALKMGAQESLKKWGQGSLLMTRQSSVQMALQIRRGQGRQGSLSKEGTEP